MKPIHYLIYALTLAAMFGMGYMTRWYTSPLGCPLCICKQLAIAPDYAEYWTSWLQRFAVPALWLVAGLVVALVAIGAGVCGVWYEHHRANEK
jgi:hypothetical protein